MFQSHAQMIYRHAVRITADWALAEDVVSLTFLEAWRLRGKLRDEGDSPLPWLMGIATNVLRNRARAVRRHQRAMVRLPVMETVPDFADELICRMGDAEQLAAAQAGLARLRQSERDIFTLCVWSGLSYHEAAQALGVPVGTVRSRLARARGRLRKLAEAELKKRQADRRKSEPVPGSGQVQGGRSEVARSSEERNR